MSQSEVKSEVQSAGAPAADDRPTVLVTGVAGFIGYHLVKRLLALGYPVVGMDNVNDYYDPALKEARLADIGSGNGFTFLRADISDLAATTRAFEEFRPAYVLHMAAQAGVRYSIENPHTYSETNLAGFLNILEGCRHNGVRHLVYASSSSVYGANEEMPFSEHHTVDHPVSLYAATKKANELMAHTYSHLFALPTTGLRFFTVYGPWGRPDMAIFKFVKAIGEGRPIDVYNHGRMKRDFTYIDDIVEGVIRTMLKIAEPNPDWSGMAPDPATSYAPWRVYNIGNSDAVELMHLIRVIEAEVGKPATLNMLPMQPGDVPATYADISLLDEAVGFRPSTSIEDGVKRFVDWYRGHYGL